MLSLRIDVIEKIEDLVRVWDDFWCTEKEDFCWCYRVCTMTFAIAGG